MTNDISTGKLTEVVLELQKSSIELIQAIKGLDSRVQNLESQTNETLEAVQLLSTSTDEQFAQMRERTDQQLAQIKGQMVTKDYLDEKMGDLRGDMVQLMRMEDAKVDAFIEINKAKKFIGAAEAKRLIAMGPFPKLAL